MDDIRDGAGMSSALVAPLFSNPELLAKLQGEYAVWQQHIECDGGDRVQATIVRLAADGLWFSEIFGLGKPDDELRAQVVERLVGMTRQRGAVS